MVVIKGGFMLVKKEWKERSKGGLVITYYTGWYLFGFIPLYIKSVEVGS